MLPDDYIKKAFINALFNEVHKRRSPTYEELEHSKSIQTVLTDADILRIQIDGALDCGDEVLFMKLTDQLKEVSESVKKGHSAK